MHEHLLGIAQKIIQNSAPADISHKYYMLKESIMRKYENERKRESSSFNYNRNMSSYGSRANLQEKLQRTSSTSKLRQSNKTNSNKLSKTVSKKLYHNANIENIMKQTTKMRAISEINGLHTKNNCLQQKMPQNIAYIQKNILRTGLSALVKQIAMLQNQPNYSNQLNKSIKQSEQFLSQQNYANLLNQNLYISLYEFKSYLQLIWKSIKNISSKKAHQHENKDTISNFESIKVSLGPTTTTTTTKINLVGIQQLQSDNKWLISNLQEIMKQNTVLRRMVGKTKN